jgi:hypothetical protein
MIKAILLVGLQIIISLRGIGLALVAWEFPGRIISNMKVYFNDSVGPLTESKINYTVKHDGSITDQKKQLHL